jgi:hypothetical protein
VSIQARRLPVMATVRSIWRDTPLLLLQHPLLWGVGLAAYLVIATVDARWTSKPGVFNEVGPFVAGFAIDVIVLALQALVLIPAALATHRTVILGVVETPGAIIADRERVARYGQLEALLIVAIMIVFVLAKWAMKIADAIPSDEWPSVAAVAVVIGLILLCCYLVLRAAASFPAAAVGDGWRHVHRGWQALHGRMSRLIGIVIVTPVGLLSMVWLGAMIYTSPSWESDTLAVESARTDLLTIAMPAFAAYAWVLTMSHVYKAVFAAADAGDADPPA